MLPRLLGIQIQKKLRQRFQLQSNWLKSWRKNPQPEMKHPKSLVGNLQKSHAQASRLGHGGHGSSVGQTVRNRSNPYLAMTCARLVANIAQIIQGDIEKEQKQLNLIDRKLRRKIAEKKQLHGQKMG